MKIVRSDKSIFKKFNKENRKYYLFNDFEIIVTELEKGDIQKPHSHNKVLEIYYIVSGTLEFYFSNNETEKNIILGRGDVIVFYPGEIHGIKNNGRTKAVTITFKKIYENSDFSDIFKSDKVNFDKG